jgi:hypothetical protein
MKGKKILYLMLALLMPVLVFIFLKYFGKNEFHVEPLFQSGIPIQTYPCPNVQAPYRIDGINEFNLFNQNTLAVIVFASTEAYNKELSRLTELFQDQPISLFLAAETFPDSALTNLTHCVFLMSEPNNIALVDKDGFIRGQYNFNKLDEVDRLIVELKIILKLF